MHQKHSKDAQNIETELHRHFWVVNDMFTFENIGFSNTIGNRKFLTCADCDMGPVGYHDIDNKKCYIALKRVRHGNMVPTSPAAAAALAEAFSAWKGFTIRNSIRDWVEIDTCK